MNTILSRNAAAVLVALLLTFGAFALPALAHDGEDHSHGSELTEEERAEKMRALIAVLQELITLLTQHSDALAGIDLTAADEDEHEDAASLEIGIEEHGGTTHIHVNESGVETDNFFLEDIALTDRDAVIAAIAERIERTIEEVSDAVTFPSEEDGEEHEEGDEHEEGEHEEDEEGEHEEDEEVDLEGIHIMADGTIMLGSGEALTDATITDDNMIMLADGTLVEPEHDLR